MHMTATASNKQVGRCSLLFICLFQLDTPGLFRVSGTQLCDMVQQGEINRAIPFRSPPTIPPSAAAK